jgi:hypothetical protein
MSAPLRERDMIESEAQDSEAGYAAVVEWPDSTTVQ